MPTMHLSPDPLVPDKIPSQESPLSPKCNHAITTLMGHPLSSEAGKHIKKWIIYHKIHNYTMFALKWNPTQFKLDMHQQMYQGWISCLSQRPHSQETCYPYEIHESAHLAG